MVRLAALAGTLVVWMVVMGLLATMAGCAGSASWGDGATSLGDAGQRVVAVAPEVGRGAGTIVGGTLGGAPGAAVGGDLGEWITKGLLGLIGVGGVVDSAKQRKKRGQAEADKREAEVKKREAEASAAVVAATAGKAAVVAT